MSDERTAGGIRVRAIAEAVLLMVHGVPGEELDEALAYLDGFTTTNCWCVEYALRDGLRQIIGDHRAFLKRQALSAPATTEGEPNG